MMVFNSSYLQIRFLGTYGLSIGNLIKSVNAAYLYMRFQSKLYFTFYVWVT